jgi:CMP-N-acetylneuraminic acid synthetase
VGVIHAKESSERLPNKNLRQLQGEPLFIHAVKTSLETPSVDLTVIDSDSEKIRELGEKIGAKPIVRPTGLASNDASGDDLAYWQASNFPDYDVLVQIVPTAPFITPETVEKSIRILQETEIDSVASVRREAQYIWESGSPAYFDEYGEIPNSFELNETTIESTGLYTTRIEFIIDNKRRLNPNSCTGLEVNQIEAVNIDTINDLIFARLIALGMNNYYDSYSASWRDNLE